ncbi:MULTISPECIES: hypothetical protein [unclassified Labrenzia]|uniref:hypothetical protein n=1 Tax=unclassified Labrenzia TaxID=2648686 RepID=UPI001267C77C|nr:MULTISPECIES: hypothetical protein [unclassified Labrenzia]
MKYFYPDSIQYFFLYMKKYLKLNIFKFVLLLFFTILVTTSFLDKPSKASENLASELAQLLESNIFRYGDEELQVNVDGCRIAIISNNNNCYYPENTEITKNEICLREFESIKVIKNSHSSSMILNPGRETRKKIETLDLFSKGKDEDFGILCPSQDKLFTKTANFQCNGGKYFLVDPGGANIRLHLGSEKIVEEKLNYYLNTICKGE